MGIFRDRNWEARIEDKLDEALGLLETLTRKEEVDMATIQEAFAALTQEVTDTQGVANSAITLIQGLRQQIADLIASGSVTPEQLEALTAQLDASEQALASAVAANP